MSDYIVSARKYRPDSFESLIGQDTIARTLSNSIRRGQLAHAYLFCGPRGVGKTTTARIFAKMINCAHPGPEMEPCGECESCVSFQEGRSYCIHELDAASNNSVEDIKTLMEQVQVPPQVGKYSVYIIDEVHMLSQSAFNAFLKTLEEPPAHAIFILATTEKHKILPTILSRCQTYDFNRISIPDMVKNLRGIAQKEGITIDDESLHEIASKADGAMRDALTIFDQTVAFCGTTVKYEDVIRNLGVLDYKYCFQLVENFLTGNYAQAFLTFDEILAKGFNALHFVGSLSSHLRNLVVAKTGGLEPLLELPDSLKKLYQEQASRCSHQFLYEALGITTACETGYKAAVNPRLHIEFTLMRLSYLMGKPSDKPVVAAAPAPEVKPAPVPEVKPEVKPAPAPEVKPAPQAEAPVRRRTPKTGSALSMSALMEEKKEEEAPVEAAPQNQALPEDEVVRLKWKELAGQYSSKPRLQSMLQSGNIQLSEENGTKLVEFFVTNEAQKQWVEEKMLRELENKLRELVTCTRVNVLVSVTPMEEIEKVPYMPEEKAKDLMEKNPEVRAFVADMGLDTK
ncbi:MAG: DNA polymerase III subunit gamma/tau [Bacteroidales bacterium]|jgi:DNA polymerase-3 subunit gamma/tau|nr:DNA polymerase III subunit gamma/tau [Bacteroidales bacterium]